MEWAGRVGRQWLTARSIDPDTFDSLYLGMTVPQHHSFYGAPWLATMLGTPQLAGPTFAQACATSARTIAEAAMSVECSVNRTVLCVTADRVSNGPHLYYPNPLAPGGRGTTEEWTWDNFNCDPSLGIAMIETAENVAHANGITREEQDAVTLERYEQYAMALADCRAFQRRYMLDLEVPDPSGKRVTGVVAGDEGVRATSAEGLAGLRPVLEGGTVTYGGQTHPADANCGLIVTSREQARELARDPRIEVRIVGFGQARERAGHMGEAPVPAAAAALGHAGLGLGGIAAIKTHNPFVVNDIYFARQTGVETAAINRYGSSLVYGHPHGPTGMRLVIELVEELTIRGGGYGLFTGCAAGDTAAALVVSVSDAGES